MAAQQQQPPPQLQPQHAPALPQHQQQQQHFKSAADPVVDPSRLLPGLRAASSALPPIGAGLESHGHSSSSMQQPQQQQVRGQLSSLRTTL
jgi:hypothetical protein